MYIRYIWTSLITQLVKNPPAVQETLVRFLGRGDPLEKGKAAHSSVLAWRIPWTVQSMGSQRGAGLSDPHLRSVCQQWCVNVIAKSVFAHTPPAFLAPVCSSSVLAAFPETADILRGLWVPEACVWGSFGSCHSPLWPPVSCVVSDTAVCWMSMGLTTDYHLNETWRFKNQRHINI